MIRLLVVDDQDLVRAGLRGILHPRYGLEVVGECADGAEVPDAVARLRPDVVSACARTRTRRRCWY
jgi:DNA-binding NarL/FixJ family response regulator